MDMHPAGTPHPELAARRLEPAEDIRAWAREAWIEPSRHIAAKLGAPGYTMPPLSGFTWHPLVSGSPARNVTINASAQAADNWLLLPPEDHRPATVAITLYGHASRNIVVVGPDSHVSATVFLHGIGGVAVIGPGVAMPTTLSIRLWDLANTVLWGAGSTANEVSIIAAGDGRSVLVGDDCMFARDITLRCSDHHAMVDMRSGRQINDPASVLIEPHVWIGQDTMVLKGVRIGYGAMIGAKSLVNQSVPRFSMAAGVPSRVIRSDVSWSRKATPEPDLLPRLRAMADLLDPPLVD